jgi:hypothetical protein
MKPGCIGKSNTNNLPAPTDLTENLYGKKKLVFYKDATQKSASMVLVLRVQGRFARKGDLRKRGLL